MTASVRRLAWDSAFFGCAIAQAEAATADDVATIDGWAAHESIRCMYLLISMNELPAIQAAEQRGFFLTAVRSTYRSRAPFDLSLPAPLPTAVRTAGAPDVDELKQIAARSHGRTRFYSDAHFSRADCDRLYATWIQRSCGGWADRVLVADVERRVGGYITVHRSAEDRTHGSIGLFAVAEFARGSGVGLQLIAGAMRWFDAEGVRDVSVATQAHNLAALSAYQRAGFSLSAVDVWLHKWW